MSDLTRFGLYHNKSAHFLTEHSVKMNLWYNQNQFLVSARQKIRGGCLMIRKIPFVQMNQFCRSVFVSYGFTEEQAEAITDVLLTADLFGIESHGVQRMVRYHDEITRGMVDVKAKPDILYETDLSAVLDANKAMGQLTSIKAMSLAIGKADQFGIGLVTVRNSNHYGIAGYYAKMACDHDLIGISMTNTEAIMVPTFGRQAMLGTNPIALAMPADPIPFLFDAATTVVPRGKIEIYRKMNERLPVGWAVDANGTVTQDAALVLDHIIKKKGGGILPIGGVGETLGGHKGYGLALICELMTGIMAGGPTANHLSSLSAKADLSHCFIAVNYGLFGEKKERKDRFSQYLQELRASAKAVGCERIYTHGEKEFENSKRIRVEGIPVNEKTYDELRKIAQACQVDEGLLKDQQ